MLASIVQLAGVKAQQVQEVHGTFTCSNCNDDSLWTPLAVAVVAGVLTALAGSILGFLFGRRLLKLETQEQIKILAKKTQHDAARSVNAMLHTLGAVVGQAAQGREGKWGEAFSLVNDDMFGCVTELNDEVVSERIQALNYAVVQCLQFPEVPTLSWAVQRAMSNLRNTLTAFIAGDPLPEASFPTAAELYRILWSNADDEPDLANLSLWLKNNPPEEPTD